MKIATPLAQITANLTQISRICDEIKRRIATKSHFIFLLDGDIGAGKTSLVSAFAKYCGIDESVTSPTFSLLHIYSTHTKSNAKKADSAIIYHYDLYQKGIDSAIDLGLLDLLENEGIHFVEWGDERLLQILKDAYDDIAIIAIGKIQNARIYTIKERF